MRGGRGMATVVERPVKKASESHSYMAEILGQHGLLGKGIRLSAGELLKVIDLCAASSAMKHAGHFRVPTLAVDHLDLLVPVCHGELVHMDSRVVDVGGSTVMVQVVGRKKDLLSRLWVPTHTAYVTFVSVGADGKKQEVPDLLCETEEEEREREYVRTGRRVVEHYKIEQAEIATLGGDQKTACTTYPEMLKMSETEIHLRKNFLPRNLNGLGTVFGGDLLEWMDGAATMCASNFLRNANTVTISIDSVFFKQPILPRHVLDLTAKVIYTRRHSIQVEVVVKVNEPPWIVTHEGDAAVGMSQDSAYSHRGYFTILNCNEIGHKRPVLTGLALENDPEAQVSWKQAVHRYAFWQTQFKTGAMRSSDSKFEGFPFTKPFPRWAHGPTSAW